eukprot:TRINITY_DN106803_c0_g1_i1.p1 TRINITY_DN106803_c0_g1~~TRINITY_DN106803_c0_g1_i1.p1  ORF type:complete len:101 (+),score=16.36 TRINITY_DN106803_c0_g1_i1:120-422(+)
MTLLPDEAPSDSYLVEGQCLISVTIKSWYSIPRCTILRDCTTSPIMGRCFGSSATHAAAMVHTFTKSSFGYFPPRFGSASSSNLSLRLRNGRAYNEEKPL